MSKMGKALKEKEDLKKDNLKSMVKVFVYLAVATAIMWRCFYMYGAFVSKGVEIYIPFFIGQFLLSAALFAASVMHYCAIVDRVENFHFIVYDVYGYNGRDLVALEEIPQNEKDEIEELMINILSWKYFPYFYIKLS